MMEESLKESIIKENLELEVNQLLDFIRYYIIAKDKELFDIKDKIKEKLSSLYGGITVDEGRKFCCFNFDKFCERMVHIMRGEDKEAKWEMLLSLIYIRLAEYLFEKKQKYSDEIAREFLEKDCNFYPPNFKLKHVN